MAKYSKPFYSHMTSGGSVEAEEALVPLVLDLVPATRMIDLGCGTAGWLSAFAAHGVEEIQGVDGDWVPRGMLRIPQDKFRPFDLSQRFTSDRRYDLAMAFEVAEHLPEELAAGFVSSLVDLAPAVLFSAAVPGQGGTGHVNEQWPEYWSALFAAHGYEVIDAFRSKIWKVDALAACIRQNVLLFASSDLIAGNSKLSDARDWTDTERLAVVHPDVFAHQTDPTQVSLRRTVASLPAVAASAVRRRLASRS